MNSQKPSAFCITKQRVQTGGMNVQKIRENYILLSTVEYCDIHRIAFNSKPFFPLKLSVNVNKIRIEELT